MLDSFLTFINQQRLHLKNQSCLLAVSAGIDSTVLANLFYNLGNRNIIAHCNFGLRGEESEGDELFVKDLAAGYGFDFFSKKFDVKSTAKKLGISTQMAARDLRYAWFEELRRKLDLDWIVTAHHANDSIETTLLNLSRGTGVSGMHGISGINGKLLRPLILTSREQIRRYAEENKLGWREDSSNESDRYKRNLIRHQIIPVMKQINPSLERTFATTSQRLESASALLEEFLAQWKAETVRQDRGVYRILIPELLSASEPMYRLWSVLQDFGFSYYQLPQMMDSLNGVSGKQFLSPTHVVLIDRESLILQKKELNVLTDSCEIRGLGESVEINNFTFEVRVISSESDDRPDKQLQYVANVNPDKLIFPLKIRFWQKGDTFCPLGMGGKKKKLSDLFADHKLNRFEKDQVLVVLNGNQEIIWVAGLRQDERYKVQNWSSDYVSLTVSKKSKEDFR